VKGVNLESFNHNNRRSASTPQPSIDELEARLVEARQQAERPRTAVTKQELGEEAIRAARSESRAEVLRLERELAAAKGEQYAETLDFPIQWDIGAPSPHLLVNDYKALLGFRAHVDDPSWDGTYVKMVSNQEQETLALVEFERCNSAKLGGPNDEVFRGHPLAGRGMEGYRAQIVRNSLWIAELEQINSVHHQYRHERWTHLNHYVLWFHDSTFECLAHSYKVEVFQETFVELLSRMCHRLNS